MAVTESTWRDSVVGRARSTRSCPERRLEVLESGWWSMGPRVAELESAVRESSAGATQAIAVSNGTAALHLALLAVGCGPGDEVVLPSLNFVAAANTVACTGAVPVFCDIVGPDDLNLDPDRSRGGDRAEDEGDHRVALRRLPLRPRSVLEIAERRGIAVIEDAAHAIGASWNGRAAGRSALSAASASSPTRTFPSARAGWS